ncbi:MAG: zinc protease [Candidatus Poribacteria bacterium]|nr:MAG: zinc protease [Candidatus Poribacteria bacterium]
MTVFYHTRLENGLTVIGERNPAAQSMAAGYFVRTGARDEPDAWEGVSHFLEHMMFKGTARRSAADVNREFDEIGAQYNAFTSEENTVYYGRVLPEFQGRLLDLLTDMMRPSLREEDFAVEKKVILEEIARAEDMPIHVAYDAARRRFYEGHPLGHRVLGTAETIGRLTREEMESYFRQRYVPSNMTLVLTGRFDWEAALAQVEALTAGWEDRPAGRELARPKTQRGIVVQREPKLKKVHLIWMIPGPSAQEELRYAGGLVASAVGDDVGSRLYWALVDPGLADAASLSLDVEDHTGAYLGYVACQPEDAPKVVERMRHVLEEATRTGLTAEETERAKQKVASGQVIRSETPMGRMMHVGMEWVYRREYRPPDEAVDRLLRVGMEEIEAVLAAYPLTEAFCYALGPIERLD